MSIIKLFIAQLMGSSLVNLFNSIRYGILASSLFALFARGAWRVGCVLSEPPRVSVSPALCPCRARKSPACWGRQRGEGRSGAGDGLLRASPAHAAEPRRPRPPALSTEIRIYRNGLTGKRGGGGGGGEAGGRLGARVCEKRELSSGAKCDVLFTGRAG